MTESPPKHETNPSLPNLQKLASLYNSGRFFEAEVLARSILSEHPRNAVGWNLLAVTLKKMGRLPEAIQAGQNAVALDANNAQAHNNLGVCLQDTGLLNEAKASFKKALNLNPHFAAALNNLGNALTSLGELNDAEHCFKRALELQPDYPEAHNNLGNLYRLKTSFSLAINHYHKAIQLKSNYFKALSNLGVSYQNLGEEDKAEESLREAIRVNPHFAEAHNNLGNLLQSQGHLAQAQDAFNEAIRLQPSYAEALYNRALIRLRQKQFSTGFKDFLSRWETTRFKRSRLQSNIPACPKGEFTGRLLLWTEQGLGDEILFLSLLPLVLSPKVALTVCCDPRLHPALKRAFPEVTLVGKGNLTEEYLNQKRFDFQAPLGDMGYLCGLTEESLQELRGPLLIADPEKVRELKGASKTAPNRQSCGIAWSSANKELATLKSVRLSEFEPLFKLAGVTFVNLQYGNVREELDEIKTRFGVNVQTYPSLDLFHDIEGLFALTQTCDIVVTTSNVTAHIAGALGKRAAVLVPFGRGRLWYWHESDIYSPWYPNLRVFYQSHPTSWKDTIAECAEWLKTIL